MSGARAWRVGAGALFALVVAIASAQTMLPKSVDTPALTMTGIGDPTAPPGSARKPLPALVPTDAMAMTPAATISKASKVVIEARVSKSGDVKAQTGDLTGVSAPVAPGAKDVRVIIDRVIP